MMDDCRRSRTQELEQLRAELAKASQLLDELERRRDARQQSKKTADVVFGSQIYPSEAETRFAACVSHGLAKLSSK
jgi:hypothetical protein